MAVALSKGIIIVCATVVYAASVRFKVTVNFDLLNIAESQEAITVLEFEALESVAMIHLDTLVHEAST